MFDSLSEALRSAIKGQSDALERANSEPDPEKRKGSLAAAAAFGTAVVAILAAIQGLS
jgi:hypothetical protein